MVAASCSQLSDSRGISDLGNVLVNTSGSLRWALQRGVESCLAFSAFLAKSRGQVEEQSHIKPSFPRVNIFSVLICLLQIFWGWGTERGRKRFQVSLSVDPKGDRSIGFYQTRFSWKDSHYNVRLIPELDESFLRLLDYSLVNQVIVKVVATPKVNECLS